MIDIDKSHPCQAFILITGACRAAPILGAIDLA